MPTLQLGVIGLGTMGANLARNAARNGATVPVYNRTTETMEQFIAEHGSEGSFVACKELQDLVDALETPRAIVIMVKAGRPVDKVIESLVPMLDKGDVLIDAGNSHYLDTKRREEALQKQGFHFVGMGVSGGEEGALKGPSMMPGGTEESWSVVSDLLTKMSADDGAGGKCVTHIGPDGSGHFVKMVHNGIEYGLMQLIAETYYILKELGGVTNEEFAELFGEWNKTPYLRSFLMEITAQIFTKKDEETDNDLIDMILDKAGQKGTGKWTTAAAHDLGVAAPIITAGLDARMFSAMKEFRTERAKEAPFELMDVVPWPKEELIKIAFASLEMGFSAAYAEGFLILDAASKEYGWNLPMNEIARIWRGGCIIRSGMIEYFQAMMEGDKKATEDITHFAKGRDIELRKLLSFAIVRGVPMPAHQASLLSFDSYRTARLPQNLIQAQRDFFGAHTFERTDKDGVFHVEW